MTRRGRRPGWPPAPAVGISARYFPPCFTRGSAARSVSSVCWCIRVCEDSLGIWARRQASASSQSPQSWPWTDPRCAKRCWAYSRISSSAGGGEAQTAGRSDRAIDEVLGAGACPDVMFMRGILRPAALWGYGVLFGEKTTHGRRAGLFARKGCCAELTRKGNAPTEPARNPALALGVRTVTVSSYAVRQRRGPPDDEAPLVARGGYLFRAHLQSGPLGGRPDFRGEP